MSHKIVLPHSNGKLGHIPLARGKVLEVLASFHLSVDPSLHPECELALTAEDIAAATRLAEELDARLRALLA